MLDVEDITGIPKPEPLSIITYLSQYYHYFNKKRSSVTLDAGNASLDLFFLLNQNKTKNKKLMRTTIKLNDQFHKNQKRFLKLLKNTEYVLNVEKN